ncbi:MAG: hypothetical protein AAB316_25275, partial [Bacteroidota bacterium]
SQPGGNIVSGATTLTPTIDAPGTYVLLVTDTTNGCTASDQATVEDFTALPTVAIAEPETLTCLAPNIMLDASNSSAGLAFGRTTALSSLPGRTSF